MPLPPLLLHGLLPVNASLVLSVALGLVLASVNGFVSIMVLRRAMDKPTGVFLKRVFGSLVLRMAALLVIVGFVLWQIPVQPLAFGLAFIGGLVAALGVEVWIVLRWARARQ